MEQYDVKHTVSTNNLKQFLKASKLLNLINVNFSTARTYAVSLSPVHIFLVLTRFNSPVVRSSLSQLLRRIRNLRGFFVAPVLFAVRKGKSVVLVHVAFIGDDLIVRESKKSFTLPN